MVMLSKLDIVPNYDLSSLMLIVVGAAPLAPETENAVLTRLRECNPGIDLRIAQGERVLCKFYCTYDCLRYSLLCVVCTVC